MIIRAKSHHEGNSLDAELKLHPDGTHIVTEVFGDVNMCTITLVILTDDTPHDVEHGTT